MRKGTRKVAICVVVLAAVATAGKAALNAAFDDFKGYGETESYTITEARDRGVLVAELTAVPGELPVPGGRVRFDKAWIEERALTTHRLVWLPYERRVGGYRLHFTLAEGRELKRAAGLMFLRENNRSDAIGSNVCSDGRVVYIAQLNGPDVSALRLGLGKRFDDPLPQVVQFVRK